MIVPLLTGGQELANLLNEAEELQVQYETQGHQQKDLDELGRSSGTNITNVTGPLCTVANYIAGINNQIGRVRHSVTARANEIRTMDEKWNQFDQERTRLMKCLQQAKTAVSEIRVRENTLQGVEQLLPTIGSLLNEMDTYKETKESLKSTGRVLIQLSPSSLSSVQNAMALADSEWEVLHHMLMDRRNQCQEIITLWNECHEGRGPIDNVIQEAVETCRQQGRVNDLSETAGMNEQCRSALDKVRRTRLMLDNLLTKCNQLHNKLDNIDGFDTQAIRQEMVALQKVL